MNLGLGTAQFGSHYGVTNMRGKVPADEVEPILRVAAENGIQLLDTAAAYGDSEVALGKALWQGHPFRIVTKCLPVQSDRILPQHARVLKETFLRSLEALRQPAVHALLVHQASDLLKPGAELVVEQILDLKRQRLISRVGASFYNASEIRETRAVMAAEVVQLPVNVVDQRLILDGTLGRLRSEGVEIHARSVFLQGLLLVESKRIPAHLSRLAAPLQRFEAYARSAGISKLALTLAFLAQVRDVDVALVGVSSLGELRDIIAASRTVLERRDFSALASSDEELLNPSRWPKARAETDA